MNKQEEIRNRLIGEHLQEKLPPREMIFSFFHKAFQLADEGPFLQQWFQEGKSERIIRKLPKHLIADFSQDHEKKGIIFVQTLIERGVLREENPEVLVGVMRAIMMLRLLKEKIDMDLFPKIMDLIIDCIAEGPTRSKQ